jgi:Methyltransferase domain
MTLPSKIKHAANRWLEPYNVRIESRTADRVEMARLRKLDQNGHFSRPVFPVLPQFVQCNPKLMLDVVARFRERLRRFSIAGAANEYNYFNDYFSSPDAEIAYALVRAERPRLIIEVGSGNSTRLFKAAIADGELTTKIVSIDPDPRQDVRGIADRVIAARLEEVPQSEICDTLQSGDILFIDSSHEVRIGNDVLRLLLNVLPALENGALIHLHDIFLPYEYPRRWMIDFLWKWNEQYLVQALLQGSNQFEVIWPAHYLQRTLPDFERYFDHRPQGLAGSLWLRKIA